MQKKNPVSCLQLSFRSWNESQRVSLLHGAPAFVGNFLLPTSESPSSSPSPGAAGRTAVGGCDPRTSQLHTLHDWFSICGPVTERLQAGCRLRPAHAAHPGGLKAWRELIYCRWLRRLMPAGRSGAKTRFWLCCCSFWFNSSYIFWTFYLPTWWSKGLPTSQTAQTHCM